MKDLRIAVIGIGATGAILAAALLKQDPDTICIDPRPGLGDALAREGITVSGALNFHVPVRNFFTRIRDAAHLKPNLIFISTKTYHLASVLEEIKNVFSPGMKIVSTHNGLGPEDFIAEHFGRDAVFRISLNLGAAITTPSHVQMTFFNRPNYIGCLSPSNKEPGLQIAKILTGCGLDTEFVDNIKLYVWRKMIYKCTNASICAVTDRTIKEIMDYPPTREIMLGCFSEALAVAKATGYDLGDDFLDHAFKFLEGVGAHKDSMCYDVANKLPTEIDFLGGKIVEYGKACGIPTPYFTVMTDLVRALQDSYLSRK